MLDVQSKICLEETRCSLANCQNPGGRWEEGWEEEGCSSTACCVPLKPRKPSATTETIAQHLPAQSCLPATTTH